MGQPKIWDDSGLASGTTNDVADGDLKVVATDTPYKLQLRQGGAWVDFLSQSVIAAHRSVKILKTNVVADAGEDTLGPDLGLRPPDALDKPYRCLLQGSDHLYGCCRDDGVTVDGGWPERHAVGLPVIVPAIGDDGNGEPLCPREAAHQRECVIPVDDIEPGDHRGVRDDA